MRDTRLTPRRFGVLALLAVLILLLIISITMCSRQAEDVPVPETTEPIAATAARPVTEPAAETTEATTESTEETTVPVEDETAPPTTLPKDDVFDPEELADPDDNYIEVPDPGTPENPYVEMVNRYPGEVSSVNIFEKSEICYRIGGAAGSVITIADPNVTLTVGETTYVPDAETGVLTADLSKLGMDPVIQLTNLSASPANCLIRLTEGLGGAGNPEVLTYAEEWPVSLAEGDRNGYHYLWNASITGKVELKLKPVEEELPSEPETLEEGAAETQPSETEPQEPALPLDVIVTVGEQVIRLSQCEDGVLRFDADKESPVGIQIIAMEEDGLYPAVEEILLWTLLPDVGTEENPELLESIELIQVALEEGNALGRFYRWQAPASGTVELTADARGLDVIVSLEDTETMLSQSENGVLTFHVTRGQTVNIRAVAGAQPEEQEVRTAAAAAVLSRTLRGTLMPDPGTPENPAVPEALEAIAVTLAEGNGEGYYLRWTAGDNGVLELRTEADPAQFRVELTGPEGPVAAGEDGSFLLHLLEGRQADIHVIAVPDETGAYPAGEVLLKGTFAPDPGSSQENPIRIEENAEAHAVEFQSGQALYFSGMLHEMILSAENADGITVLYGEETIAAEDSLVEVEFAKADPEQPEAPVTFAVTSETEKTVTMSFAYPEGHEKNPAMLQLGENPVVLPEQDQDGYLLTWTAECDGQLTISLEGRTPWQYRIDDVTAGAQGQPTDAAGETLDVKAGQQLNLLVKLLPDTGTQTVPAGEILVKASFFDPLLGTEAKPILLEADPAHVHTVTIPAGETVYYTAEAKGMVLTLTGHDVKLIHHGVELVPVGKLTILEREHENIVFAVANTGTARASYTVTFQYPLGHEENPAHLLQGRNTVLLEAGREAGYFFSLTAEEEGLLELTMETETGWCYEIRKHTEDWESLIHCCQDEEPVTEESIPVSAGEELTLVLYNCGGEEQELVFTAAYPAVPEEPETVPEEETEPEVTELPVPEETLPEKAK